MILLIIVVVEDPMIAQMILPGKKIAIQKILFTFNCILTGVVQEPTLGR